MDEPKWISIKEHQPLKSCQVVVMHENYFRYKPRIAYYNFDDKCFVIDIISDNGIIPICVTHWYEIPFGPPLHSYFHNQSNE